MHMYIICIYDVYNIYKEDLEFYIKIILLSSDLIKVTF